MNTEKTIKATIFSVVGVTAIVICITWAGKEKQFNDLENRVSAYNRLTTLIGKIISVANADSLLRWSYSFNHDFYDRETIPPEDSATLLAVRRFKFELNDKLSGMINILDPAKFEKAGHDIIKACQIQIAKINRGSEELAKNN
jgi:hypothetical protein